MNPHHNKARVVSSCDADVIQIIESDAHLWLGCWISRRLELTCHTVRLETVDSGCYIIHIISPPGYDRISVDVGGASIFVQTGCEGLVYIFVGGVLALVVEALPNERVATHAANG